MKKKYQVPNFFILFFFEIINVKSNYSSKYHFFILQLSRRYQNSESFSNQFSLQKTISTTFQKTLKRRNVSKSTQSDSAESEIKNARIFQHYNILQSSAKRIWNSHFFALLQILNQQNKIVKHLTKTRLNKKNSSVYNNLLILWQIFLIYVQGCARRMAQLKRIQQYIYPYTTLKIQRIEYFRTWLKYVQNQNSKNQKRRCKQLFFQIYM
eukprot:TRINITY_DN7037_c0_g1_i3.p1 TRINITY_DN7037_c0_g1~~TRINITY_DN7037_c0_g1_i3.p1  ORF type:complete len:210 (-),score=-15.05 TRINITY_DN7037_c0_g1_i3:191-820(-)